MRRLTAGGWCMLAGMAVACSRGAPARPAADSSGTAVQQPVTITDSQTIFVAHGLKSGPAWRLEIYGEGIRYRSGNDAGVLFPAGRVEGDDSASTWSAKRYGDTGPHSLHVEFLRQRCVDGATDSVYAYKVALLVDSDARQGCGKAGTAPRPAAPPAPASPRRRTAPGP